MSGRVLSLVIALAAAPICVAFADPAPPSVSEIVAHWRGAVHASPAREATAHWRARVHEDGIARTVDVWVGSSGRYRAASVSEFSSTDEVLAGNLAELRDWNGFVRAIDGAELRRLRTEAFNAAALAFGPNASDFLNSSVADSPDHSAWMVSVTPRGGAPVVWWIDKQTWLPGKSTERDGDGNEIVTTYARWEQAGSLLTPRHVEAMGADNGGAIYEIAAFDMGGAGGRFARLTAGPSDVAMAGDVVRIPFTNEANHIVLQVSVNGHAPIGFVLDTGDDTETLSTPRLSAMGVTPYGASQLVGGGNAAASSFARDLTLSLPGVELRHQHGTVLDLSGLERAFGVPIGGILGYDFISRFVVEVDYQNNVLTLHRPTWRYFGRGTAVPITFDGGIPRADVVLSVATRPALAAHMIVDFGAADTMTLTSPFVAANDLIRLAGTNSTVFGSSGLEHQFFTQHLPH